jgi:hypothetical protein
MDTFPYDVAVMESTIACVSCCCFNSAEERVSACAEGSDFIRRVIDAIAPVSSGTNDGQDRAPLFTQACAALTEVPKESENRMVALSEQALSAVVRSISFLTYDPGMPLMFALNCCLPSTAVCPQLSALN